MKLPESPEPIAPPQVLRVNPPGHVVCPQCKCQVTCEISTRLRVKEFAGGVGNGRYTGCPACGWQSAQDVFEGEYVE